MNQYMNDMQALATKLIALPELEFKSHRYDNTYQFQMLYKGVGVTSYIDNSAALRIDARGGITLVVRSESFDCPILELYQTLYYRSKDGADKAFLLKSLLED